MMKNISLILFLIFNISFSQITKHQIFDFKTNEPISFSTIIVINNEQTSFYSDEKGIFDIDKSKIDSIQISSLGYVNLILKTNQLTDSVFLTPKVVQLNEIIIKQNHLSKKKIKPKKAKLLFNLTPTSQLGILVQNRKNKKNSYLKKIHIPIRNETWTLKKSFNSVFRIHLFSNKNNVPDIPLIDKPFMIFCNQDSNDFIDLNISEEEINFNENGFFICIEMLGEIDNDRNIKKNKLVLPAFEFTNKESKDILITTYEKNFFTRNEQWQLIDESRSEFLGYINFIVGLTLVTYED
jgi:hypothetical protein